MNKLFYLLSIVLLTMFASCSNEFDDSKLQDRLNRLEEEQKQLEEEHKQMQEQIDAQQTLLDALTKNLTIVSIVETDEGYVVTFSDNSTMIVGQGNSYIENIEVGEEAIIFTLADGTEVVLPLNSGGNSDGEVVGENNKIYYTTIDGKKLFPYDSGAATFGAILISNTYIDGQGVLTFDDSVTTIGKKAFQNCSSLTSITIPDSVTTIGGSAFYGCSSITSVYISDLSAWCKIEFGDSANPLQKGANLYLNNELVTDLVIPSDITEIKSYLFSGCSSLTSITIPDSVTTIGGSAFSGCTGELVVNCNIPSASSYSYGAFYGSKFTSVTIGDSVTAIGDYAFYDYSSLISVYISDLSAWCKIDFGYPANPLQKGANLYLNNELVTDLVIPSDITEIKPYVFGGCSSLTSVTIPDSVTTIGGSAFSSCSSLTSITIGDGVTTIGDSAFACCSSLTSVTIPDGVTAIGDGAFSFCYSLTSVTIPDSVTSIEDHAFDSCSSLTNITIPDSVTTIGGSAFFDCSSLTSVTIPDGITTIGDYAFTYCSSLTSVTIPDNVTTIGNGAFESCSSLTSVYCKAVTPPTGSWSMFYYNASGRKIYVPMESVEAYKSASGWSDYADAIVGYNF